MIRIYIKTAVRFLLRQKRVTLLNIFGFALGILCAFIILIWVNYELSYDQFHEKKDRIYRVVENQIFGGDDNKADAQLTEWLYPNFKDEIPEIERSGVLLPTGTVWMKSKNKVFEIEQVYFINNDFLEIFTFNVLNGNLKTAFDKPNSIIITRSVALKIFNKINVAGEVLYSETSSPYSITAVIDDIPNNSHFQANMFVSNAKRIQGWDLSNYNHMAATFVLLKENILPEDIQDKIDLMDEKYMPRTSDEIEFYLQPLADIHLKSEHINWEINHNEFQYKYILIFIVVAFFIMIIASINFINLTVAYSYKRTKEIGIRKILGSKSTNIILQLLIESILLSFISFWLAIILTELILPYLNSILNLDLKLVFGNNMKLIFQMITIVLIASIISAIYPALKISKVQPSNILKGLISNNSVKPKSSNYLVIFQLILASSLIICAISVRNQLNFMIKADYGFERDHIVLLPFYEEMQDKREVIGNQLLSNSAIVDVTSSCREFGRSLWRNGIHFEGEDQTKKYSSPYSAVAPNFLNFYNIELVKGRDFNENDTDTVNKVFLVNEELVKSLELENPIGKKFRISNTKWGRIIGVIKDFNYRSLHHNINPMVYHIESTQLYSFSVKVDPNNISGALDHIKEIWAKYVPDKQFKYKFLDDTISNLYANEKRTTKLISIFSIFAIMISCIGLLGLIIFLSLIKTKEIGIRKVHGAKIIDVVLHLNSEFLKWIIIANLISCPISYFILKKWLQSFAFTIDLKWWIFVLASIITIVVTLITTSWQSYAAARKNPIESLRYE